MNSERRSTRTRPALAPLALAALYGALILCACRPLGPGSADNERVRGRGEGKDRWYDALPRPIWSEFRKVEQSQDWFEVYEIEPGIFAIYEPGQFEEVISYLILGSERALLFDTGLGIGDLRRVVSELTDLEPTVLNSHTHYDHIGGNHQFRDLWAVDTEFTRANARGKTHAEVREAVGKGWIWKPTPAGFSAEAYRIEPFAIVRTVQDGERIDLGGRTLEVVRTPGHTPDSLCLLDREHRLLFTGDTFYPDALYAHLEGAEVSLYRQSAQRLAAIAGQVDHLLPAHNEPLVSSVYLVRMRDAFESMREPGAPFVLTDGSREYKFEGFSILVPDPPPF